MNSKEAIRKLEYSKKAYQMLIDEKVDSGKLVGKNVKGEWKADTPLNEAYKSMIDALEMGIKAIKALEQEPILDKIRAEVEQLPTNYIEVQRPHSTVDRYVVEIDAVLRVLDKYKAEK